MIYEHRRQPLVSPKRFFWRLGRAALLWVTITLCGLAIGMAGYMGFEGLRPLDAFLNAAMILAGMGPVDAMKSDAGKFFAGCYAIFSGLLIVVASGFVLAPIVHRVLHAFHVEQGKDKDDD